MSETLNNDSRFCLGKKNHFPGLWHREIFFLLFMTMNTVSDLQFSVLCRELVSHGRPLTYWTEGGVANWRPKKN